MAQAKLTLCDEAVLKYRKPCRLPFAIKPTVGVELDRLEKNGVIKSNTVRLGNTHSCSQEARR